MKEFHFCSPLSKKAIYLEMKNSDVFVGDVTEESFSVMVRSFYGNNVLNPKINAVVGEKSNTTQVDIKVGLHRNDKIGFCIMALLHSGLICYFIIRAVLESSVEPIFPIFALLIFDIIFILHFSLTFNSNVRKAINKLKKVLGLK
ncbi:MAG: hypothetical protein IKV81_04700 [Clostridia bacterium]|nr:hypothetical protein [Clostridia bacterium]